MAVADDPIEELAEVLEKHEIEFRKIDGVLWVYSHGRAVARGKVKWVNRDAIRHLNRSFCWHQIPMRS